MTLEGGVLALVGSLLFVAASVLSLTFVTIYAFRSNWRSTAIGRALMGFMVVITAIMLLAILFSSVRIDGDTAQNVTRVVMYGLLCIALLRLNLILVKEQNYDRYRQAGQERQRTDP